MTAAAVPYVTATERPLPFRRRTDLVVAPQPARRGTEYAIKDPVGLRYHRLREHEFFVLERLDGGASLSSLQRAFEARFAPETVDAGTMFGFVQDLYDAGLVERLGAGEGERRWEAAERRREADWWERATNVLAVRFRGFDPEPVLAWLERWFGWLLAPPMVLAYAVLVLSAIAAVAIRWDEVAERLPTVSEFFTPANLVLLVAVVAFTKVLHELGHALVQRRFGGECHEMGLLLLVFTPCLYCDVSDAWMLRSRWKRIAVSGAGIAVELVLAAICTFVWWTTPEGLVNSLCLNLVIASTVGTVLFNGNPLLRYDGYFVLSDLVGVPNLGQRADAEVGRLASRWCLGREVPETGASTGERVGLVVYGLAAKVYRVFVLAVIGWVLHHAAKPYGLSSAVALLMLAVVATMVVRGAANGARRLANPLWRRTVQPRRMLVAGLVLGGIAAGVLFVPLPRTVRSPGLVELADAEAVFVRVAGTVEGAAEYGTRLRAGETVATLVDPELDLELVRLRGERIALETRISNLEDLRQADGTGAEALPALREALATAREAERQRERDYGDLVVLAPRAGRLVPPPERRERPADAELGTWSGRPLDDRNRGATLERGTLLGHVGDPARLEFLAIVDETEVTFLDVGQRATVEVPQHPGEVLEGRVDEIAEVVLDEIPDELATWAELPRTRGADGASRLVGRWFRVRVAFERGAAVPVAPRARGWVNVHVAPQTPGARVARWLRTLLRFES